jgi:hypothetical protein
VERERRHRRRVAAAAAAAAGQLRRKENNLTAAAAALGKALKKAKGLKPSSARGRLCDRLREQLGRARQQVAQQVGRLNLERVCASRDMLSWDLLENDDLTVEYDKAAQSIARFLACRPRRRPAAPVPSCPSRGA